MNKKKEKMDFETKLELLVAFELVLMSITTFVLSSLAFPI